MPKHYAVLVLFCCALLTGCGAAIPGQNYYSYEAPEIKHINNSKVVDLSFDQAWDKIVAKLSASYFVINNIDKQSRIINLSFSDNTPTDYVDCGKSIRKTWRGKAPVQTITYPVVASSSFTLEGPAQEFFEVRHHFSRNTSLDGRINIYLAPVSKTQTKFTVTGRYVVTNNVRNNDSYTHVNNPSIVQYSPPNQNTFTDAFTTNLPYRKSVQEGNTFFTVQCGTKGTLEKELLDLL